MAIPDLPLERAAPCAVEALSFDHDNPRFTPDADVDGDDEVEVFKFMKDRADLGELLQSIAASGYVDIEPLIVMSAGEKLITLEGNRRLAALKLFRDPALAEAAGINLPALDQAKRPSLETVTVYRVENRAAARDFIGFKHINGPHRWDSLAKAKYAAQWYRDERDRGTTLRDIASKMGDRHDTIARMVAGIYVLDQAEKTGVFNVDERYPGRPFAFSHLYTALTRSGYRDYLGLGETWRADEPTDDPVPTGNLPQLRQVMLWLYGSAPDKIRPVVTSQNPHVKQLGEVLAKPKARALMTATGDLATAYMEVDTAVAQFERSLINAHQVVEQVMRKVSSYDGRDETLLQLSSELKGTASSIHLVMNAAFQSANPQ